MLAAAALVAAAPFEASREALQPSTAASSADADSSFNAVRWIHIPKTGSSFGSTIYRHGCTNIDDTTYITGDNYPIKEFTMAYPPSTYCKGGLLEYKTVDGHHPSIEGQNSLVTLFREPSSIKKSFLDFTIQEQRRAWAKGDTTANASTWTFYASMFATVGNTAEAHATPRDGAITTALINSLVDKQYAAAKARGPVDAARCPWLHEVLPRSVGCQSKMTIFNEGCLDNKATALEGTARAVNVTRDLPTRLTGGFAGLTERFNETVCAFHQYMAPHRSNYAVPTNYGTLAPHGSQPIDAQFVHARSSDPSEIDWIKQTEACGGNLRSYLDTDPADEALYAGAQRAFDAQIASLTGTKRRDYESCVRKHRGNLKMVA